MAKVKTVRILKDKHQGDVWLDSDGDFWVYDGPDRKWYYFTRLRNDTGWYRYDSDEICMALAGPFKRIHKYEEESL